MTTDQLIAALAAVQQEMVARRQLLDVEISDDEIQHRLDDHRLHSKRWGVYKVGSPKMTPDAMRMGATLVAPATYLSHRDGLAMWGAGRPWWKAFEVSSPHRIRRDGIKGYQVELQPDEVDVVRFIPVSGPHRSVLDCASLLTDTPANRRWINQMLNELEYHDVTDSISFIELLERHRRHRGRRLLETVLEHRDPARTESPPEEFALTWLRSRGFPEPEVNVWREINGRMRRFDLAWIEEKIGGEIDTQGFHTLLDDRENDYVNDLDAQIDGWDVVRISQRLIEADPEGLERRLRQLFAARDR